MSEYTIALPSSQIIISSTPAELAALKRKLRRGIRLIDRVLGRTSK